MRAVCALAILSVADWDGVCDHVVFAVFEPREESECAEADQEELASFGFGRKRLDDDEGVGHWECKEAEERRE